MHASDSKVALRNAMVVRDPGWSSQVSDVTRARARPSAPGRSSAPDEPVAQADQPAPAKVSRVCVGQLAA